MLTRYSRVVEKLAQITVNTRSRLEKRSPLFWLVETTALIALIGALDYLTGHEISLSLIYLIPISLVTWFRGARPGIAASIACAVTLLVAAVAAGQTYSSASIFFWNTGISLGFFVTVTLLLAALRNTLERETELAQTDYLTGAVNGRRFLELAQMEINRSYRYKHPFTVAYLDLDDFKTINDRLGHHAGDEALRTVVDSIRRQIRKTDSVARLGGDEFALLLPETEQQAAQVVVSKIQRTLLYEMQKNQWPVTCSIGVLTCINAPATVDDMIKMVDGLMYSVKRTGKNEVIYSVYES